MVFSVVLTSKARALPQAGGLLRGRWRAIAQNGIDAGNGGHGDIDCIRTQKHAAPLQDHGGTGLAHDRLKDGGGRIQKPGAVFFQLIGDRAALRLAVAADGLDPRVKGIRKGPELFGGQIRALFCQAFLFGLQLSLQHPIFIGQDPGLRFDVLNHPLAKIALAIKPVAVDGQDRAAQVLGKSCTRPCDQGECKGQRPGPVPDETGPHGIRTSSTASDQRSALRRSPLCAGHWRS
mmetsp:Transcript_18249/g.28813  ORF Transcript_18249/g.28813 Transcript_18249/m.28813 type:complete len:234 (+) Transcript_18249:1768-2469(+)